MRDSFTGKGDLAAQGEFVVVYYVIQNDMKSRMQPAVQINDRFIAVDSEGRTWRSIDYRPPLGTGISGDFAVLKGGRQPEEWVDPGFSLSTAIAFDIPRDAEGVYLLSKDLNLKLSLAVNL